MELERNPVPFFKALSDERRMEIFQMLSQQGELCACRILEKLDFTQPTLSHHMKILCDSQVVTCRKEGKWTHYSINRPVVEQMRTFLDQLLNRSLQPATAPSSLPAFSGEKIQLYLLTGFLGSGKTTILLRLLQALQGEKVGVIQNEFGKLGVDGSILRQGDIQMVELNRGSIFCSCLKLNFVQALADMSKMGLRYLFVESSGLGDPSNFQEILRAVEVLAGDCYQLRGAICLVDAENFLQQLDDLETVERQLKHCHLAVITKVDLVDPERLSVLHQEIRKINPRCRITVSSKGNLDLSFLQEDLLALQWAQEEESTNVPETKPKSIFLNCQQPVRQQDLQQFLDQVKGSAYRIKGFFQLEGLGWNQVDVVGERVTWQPCPPQELSQLVFISRIGPAIIKELFAAWEKTVPQPMQLKN